MKLSVTGSQKGLKKRQFDGRDSRLLEIWKESETVLGGMSYIIRCW